MTELPPTAPEPAPGPLSQPPQIRLHHALLIGIIFFAAFTRFWRLGEPSRCYFDEVYFPTAAGEILRGKEGVWNFYTDENTHPPLSKILMAGGELVFGLKDYQGGTNDCYTDDDDKEKQSDPHWLFDPFGFRFPGALAGVGSVVFMYLLARALFKSEVAALASSFLLSLDGLVLTQSRIATPDTYVLFFMLASVYFLVTRRWLLSGFFLGATAASKWIGAFTVIPIVIYFAWTAFVRWKEAGPDRRLREAERVLAVGAIACVLGVALASVLILFDSGVSSTALLVGGAPFALGSFVIMGGLIAILTERTLRSLPRSRVYISTALSFPLFFIAVPFAVYMASYIPMFIEGLGLDGWWDQNRMAYEFHSSLRATHGYQSHWWGWPLDQRPVYFYLGPNETKIYNLGNPLIYWMSIPALVFTAWQGVRFVRTRVDAGARLRLWGSVGQEQFVLLFVVLSYLGFWLSLSTQGRALFSYHYQPALAFAVLALGYTIHWLWAHPHPWARYSAIAFLAAATATFVYFYPHWTAIDVPRWLDDSYFWFRSWR